MYLFLRIFIIDILTLLNNNHITEDIFLFKGFVIYVITDPGPKKRS